MVLLLPLWHFLNGYVFKPINYGFYTGIMIPADRSWKYKFYSVYYWRFPSQIPEMYQQDLTYWETIVWYGTSGGALVLFYHFVYVPLVNITYPWWDPYIP